MHWCEKSFEAGKNSNPITQAVLPKSHTGKVMPAMKRIALNASLKLPAFAIDLKLMQSLFTCPLHYNGSLRFIVLTTLDSRQMEFLKVD